MGFFAHDGDRYLPFAPEREIEGHAADDRNDNRDDFRRDSGQLQDGDRATVDGHTEDAGEHLRHAVVNGERAKHEGVTGVL